MPNRKFYILFIISNLLLFSSYKSKACERTHSAYKIHTHFSKKAIQISNSRSNDFLIQLGEMDTDDETCSKVKYKLNRFSLLSPANYNSAPLASLFSGPGLSDVFHSKQARRGIFLFSKASVSLTLCCLKI